MKEFFFTETKDGVPAPSAAKKLLEVMGRFEGRIRVTVEKKKNVRSIEQNRWMWACTAILAKELGYEKEEMHKILNYKFLLAEVVDEKTGEIFKYIKSTSELTTTEFGELMESMIRWAADTFGVVLPYPDQQMTI